jgi:hypothetical protein
MEFTEYIRKPFTVQAIEITRENIEECAKFIGDVREMEDGRPYILVDSRLVPNLERVFPGYFMTKMGDNVRCYSKRVFNDQFVAADDNIAAWVAYLNGEQAISTSTPVA